MDLNMKVLIVDDLSMMRKMLRYTLKRVGLTNIIEAGDGKSAMTRLKNEKVDLIVCDWNMPGMKGIDMLNKVRSDDELKNIPFIMVTAQAQKEKIVEAITARVTDYIVKPFSAETVSEKLKKIFDG